MAFVVLLGNTFVIATSIIFLIKKKNDEIAFQHFIILNISIADFIMGVYLLLIAGFSKHFSGTYGSVDREWRSGLTCYVIGSLSILSSKTSCFLMVVLTGFG